MMKKIKPLSDRLTTPGQEVLRETTFSGAACIKEIRNESIMSSVLQWPLSAQFGTFRRSTAVVSSGRITHDPELKNILLNFLFLWALTLLTTQDVPSWILFLLELWVGLIQKYLMFTRFLVFPLPFSYLFFLFAFLEDFHVFLFFMFLICFSCFIEDWWGWGW